MGKTAKLVLLRFEDPTDEGIFSEYLAETKLSEEEVQNLAEEIAREFEEQGFEGWSYDDVVEEMEKRGYLKTIEYDRYFIVL